MATRRVKKRKRKLPKPRDPFWRVRRAFGEKREKSRKAYDRAKTKRAEREAKEED
jgi:hypothetical protein